MTEIIGKAAPKNLENAPGFVYNNATGELISVRLEARLEALKLAYEVSFKQERDLDNPKFWTKDTEESTQKNYFRSILQLAEINYKFITEGITEIE